MLTIYEGTDSGPQTRVACSDDFNVPASSDQSLTFRASIATTYWFQVGGYKPNSSSVPDRSRGTIVFNLRTLAP